MTRLLRSEMADAVRHLAAARIETPANDAWRLMLHALGRRSDTLGPPPSERLRPEQITRFRWLVRERGRRRPLSHLVGRRRFMGREFVVNGHVLDPRPETEAIILAAQAFSPRRILDLGTGSGCILLTLLDATPGATGIGIDISPQALSVASRNGRRFGLMHRVRFMTSDWFSQLSERFDLIIANPPYVSESDFATLAPEIAGFEPVQATCAGPTGLEAYRAIAAGISGHLTEDGVLALEIGATQQRQVTGIFAGSLAVRQPVNDLDGRVCGLILTRQETVAQGQ